MWGYLLLFYVFFKANSNLSRTVRTYGGSAATLLTLVLYVWAVLVLHRRSTARSCALSDSLLTWMHVSLHFGTLVWVMQMIFSARYGSQQEHDCYGYMRQRGFRDDVEHVVPPQWEAPVIPLDEPGRIRYFKVPARLQADGTMSIAGYKAKADVHFSQQRIVNDLEPTKCVALCRDLSLACCLLSMLTSHSPLALSLSLTLSLSLSHTYTLSLSIAQARHLGARHKSAGARLLCARLRVDRRWLRAARARSSSTLRSADPHSVLAHGDHPRCARHNHRRPSPRCRRDDCAWPQEHCRTKDLEL